MSKNLFERLAGFLIGASWALLVIGAFYIFLSYLVFGIFSAIFYVIIFVFFTLIIILLLESMSSSYFQRQRQTELLEEIKALLEKE